MLARINFISNVDSWLMHWNNRIEAASISIKCMLNTTHYLKDDKITEEDRKKCIEALRRGWDGVTSSLADHRALPTLNPMSDAEKAITADCVVQMDRIQALEAKVKNTVHPPVRAYIEGNATEPRDLLKSTSEHITRVHECGILISESVQHLYQQVTNELNERIREIEKPSVASACVLL